MRKTKRGVLYFFAALFAVVFVLACLAGFAACGGGDDNPEDDSTPAATVSSVSISDSTMSLKMGGTETGTLTATVTMSDNTTSTSQTVNWTSSKPDVATVSATGYTATVTAVSDGTTKITASVGTVTSAECTVTVDPADPTLSITVEPSSLKIAAGAQSTIAATLAMSDGSEVPSDTSVEWSLGKTGVASLSNATNASVTVTGLGIGTDTLTATAGEATATCAVSVTEDTALILRAEDAALMNAVGNTDDKLMKAETKTVADPIDAGEDEETETEMIVSNVTAGDEIVFQVLASDEVAGVKLTINADEANASGTALSGLSCSVNGEAATLASLTSTISLEEGVNYIELAMDENATGSVSVDSIELTWEQEEVTSSSLIGGTTVSNEPTIEAVATGGDVFEIGSAGKATLEAEDAALMNAVGSSGDTNVLGTEVSSSTGVTQVKNFNLVGDEIVFQVYASAAMTSVDLGAWVYPSTDDFDAANHSSFVKVNGSAATLTNTSALPKGSYGALTATISLNVGINYIEIVCDTNGSELFGMNLGFMNVDRVDLTWISATASDESTLRSALNSSNVIELESDISNLTTALAVATGVDATIDLNGKTITAGTITTEVEGEEVTSGVNTIEVGFGATLTIVDGVGGGKIVNNYTGASSRDNAAAIYVAEGGTLVVESGAIESSSIGIKAEGIDSSATGRATVTIDGGEISSTYFSIWAAGDADVTINGGTISGEDKGIYIGGDANFGYDDFQTGTTTTLTITGGEISCENESAICTLGTATSSSAVIKISGGTITSNAQIVYDDDEVTVKTAAPTIYLPNGTLNISGGTIISENLTAVEVRGGTVTISGGTLIGGATLQGDDASQDKSGAKTYGYALSVYPYGINSAINSRMTSYPEFDNKVSVTITGGSYVGDVYIAAAAESNVQDGGTPWQVVLNGEEDAKNGASYVVDISSNMKMTQSVITGDDDQAAVAYVYTFGYVANFVTGAESDSENVYNTLGGIAFDGSEVTSVVFDGEKYIVNGTTGKMTQEQANAFYGGNETVAAEHVGDQYIVVTIVAKEGESITVKGTSGTSYTISGDAVDSNGNPDVDWTFYTVWFNVENYSAESDSLCFTIVVGEGESAVEYEVVLGDITPATAE